MKVLIVDQINEKSIENLKNVPGITLMYEPYINSVNITYAVKDKAPDVIVVNRTKISEQVF